jgi:hypothetical protein
MLRSLAPFCWENEYICRLSFTICHLLLLFEFANKWKMRNDKRQMYSSLLIKSGMDGDHVRNPKHLPIDLETAQPVFWQVLFLQAEKRKVR